MKTGLHALALAAALSTSVLMPHAAAKAPDDSFAKMIARVALVPPGAHDSEMLARATTAVEALKKMDLPRAQVAANEALQLDARNPHLHFLNGFIYHLRARQGDTAKGDIAIEGYSQALRIDPAHWIAHEFLGLAYMDLKRFNEARASFAEALLLTPESEVSTHGLMVSAYLTGDAGTACAMADRLDALSTRPTADALRSSIAVYASCGNFERAESMRARLTALAPEGLEMDRTDRRVAQWKAFHTRHASIVEPAFVPTRSVQLARAFQAPDASGPSDIKPATPDAPARDAPPAAPAVPARSDDGSGGPRMVLIDLVLLSTQDIAASSKGVNLLSALTLQLGGASGAPAYGWSKSITEAAGVAAVTTAITRAVTIPALTYSLNIANANSSVNEVLARPTLAAIEGLPSEFFSGVNLNAGVVSTSREGGTTIVPLDKRFGIKLAVTPVFTAGGQVQMKVEAQRTALNASSDNPRVAYQIEIGEVLANANVVMNLGDTLVLSGLSEKSSTSTRDGVPGLQEVPGLQYLFSNRRTNDIQRSVLILVTPRRPAPTADAGAADTTAHSLTALRDKLGLNGSMPSNAEAIMRKLKPNEFFREFRQGDVAMERWERTPSTGLRLKEAMAALYE